MATVISLLLFCVITFDFSTSNQIPREPNAMKMISHANQGQKQDGRVYLRELDILHVPPAMTSARRDEYSAALTNIHGRLWPSGIIPYVMSDDIRKRPGHVAVIKRAMRAWERATCLKFVERANSTLRAARSYVRIIYGRGCYASLGRIPCGKADVSIGAGCQYTSVAARSISYFSCYSSGTKVLGHSLNFDGGWSSWSVWQQCDRKCGGGFQTRTRQCNNPLPASGGKMCARTSYNTRSCNQQLCPEWPHWPNDFRFLQQNFAPARFNCIKVYERTHSRYWRRVVFCWVKWKRALTFKWSDVGTVKGMRCTRISEQESSGWDNNYLCAAGDYPYQFRWSSRGPIRGLRCLQWRPEISRQGWNDNYLCATEFPQPTKAPSTGCYASWSSFQVGRTRYCYIRVFKSVTWDEAQRECRKLKAELVSVGSRAEYDFLLRELHGGRSIWLGLNDKQREGHWKWSDGTPLTFTDWSRREPSPQNRRENCAMSNVYTSTWNDYPCTSKFKFVCKTRGGSRDS